jgi:hypothetical protein
MDRQQVLSNLWDRKNLRHPCPTDDEVLEILFLMEGSIWRIFESQPNITSEAVDSKKFNSSDNGVPMASLRDAVEVLLRTSPKNKDCGLSNDDTSGINWDYGEVYGASLAQALRDLEDLLLDERKELDDDNDGQDQQPPDASIATLLWDPRFQGDNNRRRSNENKSASSKSKTPRDVEVRAIKSGDAHILEISGLGNSGATWDGDYEGRYLAADFIYTRENGYFDHIPDVTAQIFQSNGNRELRYTLEFEEEIYERFRRPFPEDYYDEDEDDF